MLNTWVLQGNTLHHREGSEILPCAQDLTAGSRVQILLPAEPFSSVFAVPDITAKKSYLSQVFANTCIHMYTQRWKKMYNQLDLIDRVFFIYENVPTL